MSCLDPCSASLDCALRMSSSWITVAAVDVSCWLFHFPSDSQLRSAERTYHAWILCSQISRSSTWLWRAFLNIQISIYVPVHGKT